MSKKSEFHKPLGWLLGSLLLLLVIYPTYTTVSADQFMEDVVADNQTAYPPQGPAPAVNAVEIAPGDSDFYPPIQGAEPEMLRPSHPPIDQIPPMPMPQEPEDGVTPEVWEPGEGVSYDPSTGETVIGPLAELGSLDGEFTLGGGYAGVDGGFDLEEDAEASDTMVTNMSQITSVDSSPWRMNAKLVMRFGTSWFVCSGTMRDAETVLTAGHCVFDYGGAGWADEIWVYPGYDGTGWNLPPDDSVGSYGWGHGTYFASWTGWTGSGDWNYDVGLVRITRAVGMLTGWFGYAYGGDCAWHTGQTYHNASYPAESCGLPGLHNGLDMYYWYGNFDSCPSWNRLQIDTSGGCFNAIWGGMSGSGAYYIDGNRYVHGICSTSDRSTWGRYARQWADWVTYSNDTFIPGSRGTAFDLQALDTNATPTTIQAGNSTTLLNHLATNPTNGTANGTWTYRVYLSTNDNISSADTLLSTQNYSYNFAAMSSVRVNMVQVTIPTTTPGGSYWLGLEYDSGTDGNSANNDTDGWDAVPITVTAAPTYTLSVTKTGTGSGTVTSSPAGINCGTDCSQAYTSGTVVTLTASPATGSTFAGWSGNTDCSDGMVTMNASKSCTAAFSAVGGGSDELAVDFGANGLWHYATGTWTKLTGWNAGAAGVAGWTGGVAADFDANGLYNYSGTSWTKLTGWNAENDLSDWSGGLAADFGANGVYSYDGTSWSKLAAWNAQALAGWSGGLAADFGANGVWNYNGTSWSKLTGWNPGSGGMSGWSGGLAADFDANGLYNYNGTSWSKITGWNAENDLSDWSGGLAADFGANGVHGYDGTSWSKLTSWNPGGGGLSGWGGDLAADFETNGLYSYGGTSWSKLTGWNPEAMDAVDLN